MVKCINFKKICFLLFLSCLQKIDLEARLLVFGKNSSLVYSSLWPTDLTFSTNSTLINNEILTSNHKAIFDTTGVIVDGGGYAFRFPVVPTTVFSVGDNVAVTLKNIWIENLIYPSHIHLGSSATITWGDNTNISFYQDQAITSTMTFSGNVSVYGNKNILNLTSGVFAVLSNSSLKLSNLILTNVTTSSFLCQDNTSSIILENVKINIPSGNTFTFPTGSMLFKGNVEFSGKGSIFSYSSTMTSTIFSNSTLVFSEGISFVYDPANDSISGMPSQVNLLGLDKTSKLSFQGADWIIRSGGMQLSKIIIEADLFKNNIYIDSASITNTAKGLTFGDGTFANNVKLQYCSGGKFSVESGVLNYKNIEETSLKYGDAIAIKHSEYGFYLSGSSAEYSSNKKWATGLVSTPTNNTRWYLEPGPYRRYDGTISASNTYFLNDRFGNGHVGQPIKCGDYIKLEHYNFTISSERIYLTSESSVAPITSSPNPPFYLPTITKQSATSNVNGDWYFIILKKGGYFGDFILKGDSFYLMGVNNQTPTFLGSSNLTISNASYGDGSGSVVKEIYFYRVSTNFLSPVFPALFERDYLWCVDDVISGAYASAPSGYSNSAEFVMPTFGAAGQSKIDLREYKIL